MEADSPVVGIALLVIGVSAVVFRRQFGKLSGKVRWEMGYKRRHSEVFTILSAAFGVLIMFAGLWSLFAT